MARSIDPAPKAVRGFVPARSDEERYLMRHIEDLARTAESRGIPRYSAFLSDREQDLARAALNRAAVPENVYHFEGGWPGAERRLLCLEPEGSWPDSPLCCVRLTCRVQAGAALPAHKDYLGSLMGLELRREALGDIVLPSDAPGTAYVFALEPAAQLICQELLQAGRTELATRLLAPDEVPEFRTAERRKCTATVSSLRLDAVLAAMLHCSRGQASELVTAGRVEINHLPAEKPSAPVYEGDVFTVRGKGRFALTTLPGKSKKERLIIEFFQY
jgi:RNA-binding protein YlmH